MRAVARLVLTYFTASPLLLFFGAAGLVLLAGSIPGATSGGVGFLTLGVLLFFVGSALMPLLFGRMARSHVVRVLPYGRVKLLLSAFVTVLLVSAPGAILTYWSFRNATLPASGTPEQLAALVAGAKHVGWLTFTTGFMVACWLYLALYFFTSQRSMAGLVKGLLVILIIIIGPTRGVQELSLTLWGGLAEIAATWLVFGAGFLLWPRWKAYRARLRLAAPGALGDFLHRQVSGREIDLMLGTANPWLLTFSQVVPIVITSTIGFYSATVWLFYLTIFSTVAGAIAGQAAEKSRALWLRARWSREELFAHVEKSFWRHNGFVLGALVALMVAIGSYAGLPVSLLAVGLPLLALGTVLSTYLGLMITRGLRWTDAILAMAVMLALMLIAVLAARANVGTNDLLAVLALETVLAVLAFILRAVARHRWQLIDWTLCRPERALAARSAA